MKATVYIIILLTAVLMGCESDINDPGNGNPGNNSNPDDWIIPRSQVYDGGPGKDGIPAIDNPRFMDAEKQNYVEDGDLVVGFVHEGLAHAYPHSILDWHEIVNDEVEGAYISVTYCPLTGTGIGWNRQINGTVTTFGVSGLLYNSNLIPYDRETDSNWSQMRLDCVNGALSGTEAQTYPVVETTWGTWKEMYPGTKVMSNNTGFNRNYGYYPYGTYRTNHEYILFPVAHTDDRLEAKVRVHGIVSGEKARIFPVSDFGEGVRVIQDRFEGTDYVIAGSTGDNFAVSYARAASDGTLLSFSTVSEEYPVIMSDQEGNRWDVFGRAVSGPRQGESLRHAPSYIGYWFSFAAFYPLLSIYSE